MDKMDYTSNRKVKRMRWAARIVGIIVAGFWVLSLIASLIAEFGTPIILEGIILGALVTINTAGVIIAWRREKVGGIIIVAGAVMLSIFAYISAGHNKIFAVLVSGFPFLVSGIIFLVSWWMSMKFYSSQNSS